MKRILEALDALASAANVDRLSVSISKSGHRFFDISVETDEQVRALAAELGGQCETTTNADREWLSCYCYSPIYVSIHGPHRPIVAAPVRDENTVAAALAQAAEAVRP